MQKLITYFFSWVVLLLAASVAAICGCSIDVGENGVANSGNSGRVGRGCSVCADSLMAVVRLMVALSANVGACVRVV